MSIAVELFGICRERAGVAQAEVPGTCLGDVLEELAARFPLLAVDTIDCRRLRTGYIANLRGEQFITDPQTPLADGDSLLLMSLDAGG